MIGKTTELNPLMTKKKKGYPVRRLFRDWSSWILIVPTLFAFFFFPGSRWSRALCSLFQYRGL